MFDIKHKKWISTGLDEKTLSWCNDPGNRDNPRAMFLKADRLLEDLSSGDVVAEAIYNMEKAADRDNPDAAFAMGQMFEYGWAVGKDRKKAKSWYEKAASLGHPEAVRALQRMKSARLRTIVLSCAAAAAILLIACMGIRPILKPVGIIVHKDTVLEKTTTIEEFSEVLMDMVAENDDALVISGDRKSNRLILKFEGDTLDLSKFPAAKVVANETNLVVIQFATEEDAEACLKALQENESILFIQEDSYEKYGIDSNAEQSADPSRTGTDAGQTSASTGTAADDSAASNLNPGDISGTESMRKEIDDDTGIEYYISDSTICPDGVDNPYFYTSPYTGERYYSWGVPYMGFDVLAAWLKDMPTEPVVVAVMDTGTVPCDETKDRILEGWSPTRGKKGWDVEGIDSGYHGTHVAGTILDCTRGLDVSILPVRTFFNEEEFNRITGGSAEERALEKYQRQLISNYVLAMEFVLEQDVDVINMSLTILQPDIKALDFYIDEAVSKGIIIVAASGNYHSEDPEQSGICTEHWPQYNDKCIVVGAIGRDGLITDFSEFGETLDVCAPGEAVMSNVVPGTFIGWYDENDDGNYVPVIYPNAILAEDTGTSMAAPHISALAAMLKLYLKDRTPEQIEQYVKEYTIKPDYADPLHCGAGLPIAAKFADTTVDWEQPAPPGKADAVDNSGGGDSDIRNGSSGSDGGNNDIRNGSSGSEEGNKDIRNGSAD
ncbi:MAG: S8 family serine peptidase [Eubacteriales bacterium]|nr:S8 family serine peptidase [Eubacteriales bacterium]